MGETMKIDLEEVERIARLAKLEFVSEEKQRFVEQFNQILAYMEKIGELDLSTVEPTTHVFTEAETMRSDIVRPSLPQEQVLANAPAQKYGLFSVPKVIGG